MKKISVVVILAFWVSLITGCATNPVTGDQQLALMTERQEIETGDKAFPIYTQAFFGVFQDTAVQEYVQVVGSRLAAVSQRPGLDYEFRVLNFSEINAFALPGGKICITRGLMAKLASEAQLAGVLGHEIGHVAARHHVAQQSRTMLTRLVVGLGQIYLYARGVKGAEFMGKAGEITAGLVLANYSRDQERQADQLGTEYMTRCGYDPQEFVKVLQTLLDTREREPDRVERLFMTHPLEEERISTVSRLAATLRANRSDLAVNAAQYQHAARKIKETEAAYVFFDQGNEYFAQEKYYWAISRFTEGIEESPDQAIIYLGRAESSLETGQLAEAERDIEAADRLYPDLFYTRYFSGLLRFKQHHWQRSIDDLQAADELLPGYPDTQFYLGRDFEEQGDRRAAAQHFINYLKQVNSGEKAQYAYNRLAAWGYVQTS